MQKNDELYHLLGEPIAPTINIIDALYIKAKQSYLFYGEGIQLDDVTEAYQRLSLEMDEFTERKKLRRRIALPKFSIPELKGGKPPAQLPGKKNMTEISSDGQLSALDTIDVGYEVVDND